MYTPGVGKCCLEIYKDINKLNDLTNRKNTVFIIFQKGNRIASELNYLIKVIYIYKSVANIDAYVI